MNAYITRKTKAVLAAIAIAVSGAAVGESATFTGTLRAISPTVALSKDAGDVVARVRESTVTATISGTTIPVYTDPAAANAKFVAGEQVLLLELRDPSGDFKPAGMALKGIPKQDGGSYSLTGHLFTLSGSGKTRVPLSEGGISLSAASPVAPAITTVATLLDGEWPSGMSVTSYKRGVMPEVLNVSVEPRNYAQSVIIPSVGECAIPEGAASCLISLPPAALPAATSETGSTTWPLLVDSSNRALHEAERLQESFDFSWDYRGPTILAGDALVDVGSPAAKSLDVDGTLFHISNGKAIVVVSTPHIGRTDNGWIPKELKLTFKDNGEQVREYEVVVDGYPLIRRAGAVNEVRNNEIVLSSASPKDTVDSYFIYELDLKDVPDGSFNMSASVVDANGNKSTRDNLAKTSLLKTEPSVYAFYNYNQFKDGQPVYFYENVAVAGHNGIKGDVSVKSVVVNGSPASMVDAGNGVAWLDIEQSFTPGETQTIDVVVVDKQGREYSKRFTAAYMPAKWKMVTTSPMKDRVYRRVQKLIAAAQQSTGETCPLVPNELTAKQMVTRFQHYCVFRWANVPEGFVANYNGAFPTLVGAYQGAGNLELGYTVTIYNHKGGQALAAAGTGSVAVIDPPTPTIAFDPRGRLSNGMYAVPLKGGNAVKAKINTVSAHVRASVGSEPLVTKLEQQQNFRSELMGFSVPGRVGAGTLWDVIDTPAKVSYVTAPDLEYSASAKVLYVPQSSVRVRLDAGDGWGVTTEVDKIEVTLGQYTSSTRKWNYDSSTMGEWNVYLATEEPNKVHRPLTSKIKIGSSGVAQFELDTSAFDVVKGGGVLYAVAELISPIDGFSRELISNKRFLRVFKGEEVQGTAVGKNVVGKVPLLADIRYTAASKSDSDVIGEIEWQQSTDGVAWVPVPGADKRPALKLRIEEDASMLVRAAVRNKLTGAVATTESIKVVAYSRPAPSLRMVNAPLVGEEAVIAAYNGDAVMDAADARIEWSLDEGKTWAEGMPEISVFSSDLIGGNSTIMARMQYLGAAEDAGERSMVATKLIVPFRKPMPPRVTTNIPRDAEVGTEVTLKASAVAAHPQLADRVRLEWTLPDGTKRADPEIKVTVSKESVSAGLYKVNLAAWIDGRTADTLVEKSLQIRTWEYQFPDATLSIPVVTRYAPSQFKAFINMPRVAAPGVAFSYDWREVEAVTFVNDTGKTTDVKIDAPGVHTISVLVKDNRGNEKLLSRMVEVLAPQPMQVTLKPVYSTSKMRYPLDVVARASAVLGHPDDRIKAYRWKHNGTVVTGDSYSQMLSTLAAGRHTVSVEVESEFGQIGSTNLEFEVVPNSPPKCTLNTSQTTTAVTFDMVCQDSDGKIVKYEWLMDGEPLSNIQRSITVSKAGRTAIAVSVTAHDDSWATETKTANLILKP